jgi:NADP-reducing hydrogenase subunit HndB
MEVSPVKSLTELETIRTNTLKDIGLGKERKGTRIIVGMATCGIAAGAKPVMKALLEEIKTRNISDVNVKMTGCIGICRLEPIVEVIDKNGYKVTYVKMNAEKAARVIAEHVVNGRVCVDYTIGAEKENA